ncbi:hypothetical protein L7F22_002649 [Adiantum nelumboides]|nr:hypothetical protein [Adiantum nelumboides]
MVQEVDMGKGAFCVKGDGKDQEDSWGGDGYLWSSLSAPWKYVIQGGITIREEDLGGGGEGLQLDGAILAVGGYAGVDGGGGSGASILIKVFILNGTGEISAFGGMGWAGGGGGRVSIESKEQQDVPEMPEKNKETDGGPWQFCGLLPLFDPPHHDCAETIRRALNLGVNVKMLTGDQLAIGALVDGFHWYMRAEALLLDGGLEICGVWAVGRVLALAEGAWMMGYLAREVWEDMVAKDGKPGYLVVEILVDFKEQEGVQVCQLAKLNGYRTLFQCRTEMPEKNKETDGGPWHFYGLLPLFDPPRHDCVETIRRALNLGVNVKMVTGDQLAIAKETGRCQAWLHCVPLSSSVYCCLRVLQ